MHVTSWAAVLDSNCHRVAASRFCLPQHTGPWGYHLFWKEGDRILWVLCSGDWDLASRNTTTEGFPFGDQLTSQTQAGCYIVEKALGGVGGGGVRKERSPRSLSGSLQGDLEKPLPLPGPHFLPYTVTHWPEAAQGVPLFCLS